MAEPLPRPSDSGTVDADNPWPGLASFREADRELFYGRETETQEVLRLALRERLTVLFGLSGLGKTSLLSAGLFPLLRQENVLPVYIRLDFSADFSKETEVRRTLSGQVRQAITREATEAGIEVPAGIGDPALSEAETLWESLHRQGAELWSPRNRIVTPLLVFDQFEEVFTLGRGNAARAQEAEAFLTELADLCEGSVPADLRARLEADPSATRELSLTRHPYKILLSLREDFLPELEGLRGRIRSIVHNRFRLRRMNGDNALRVVTQAGGHLVEPDVPERIIRFVAGRESDGENEISLAELDVEPALLSVVCRELNNKRRTQGLPRITADLVRGNRDEILSGLYERSVDDLGPEVRSFIEERLLTKSGFRDSVALENAVESPGVTREALDKLTDRRLLRIEDRGGMQRLELTHDVLTGVIRKSRDSRREREAREREEVGRREAERKLRRSRLANALLAVVLLGVIALAGWAVAAQRKAARALASTDLARTANLRDRNPAQALAYLARVIRAEPESVPAQSLLADLLLYRTWPRPVAELRLADVELAHLSDDGRLFAMVDGGRVRLWDTRTLQRAGDIRQPEAVESLDISQDGRRLLILSPGLAQLWDTRTGKSLLGRIDLGDKSHALLSPDGRWLALDQGGKTLALRHIGTNVEHRISFPEYPPELAPHGGFENLGFSPDSRRIFAQDNLQILLWDVESGQSLPAPPAGRITSVSFSPDGRLLLVTGGETVLWDVEAGSPAGRRFAGDATQAWLSPRGDRLATYDESQATLRIWNTRGTSEAVPVIRKRNLRRAELSRDGQLLLTMSPEGVELWDADTGRPVNQAFCDCLQGRFLAGTRQVVTGDESGILTVWSATPSWSGTELLYSSDKDRPDEHTSPVFSLNGGRLGVRTENGQVRVWDTDAVRPVGPPIQDVASFGLSPDGRFLLEGRGNGTLQLRDAQTGRPVWHALRLPGDVYPPAFLSRAPAHLNVEKEIFGIRGRDSTVQLWSLATGRLVGTAGQGEGITDFAFSPGGDRLVTTSAKGVVRTRDPRTGQPLGSPLENTSPVTSFAFSSDGERIATGTRRGFAWIWDLRSGKLLTGPLRHPYPVNSIQFQPAGRLLLTRARNALKLWDTGTGSPKGGALVQDTIGFAELDPAGERILVHTLADAEPIRLLDSDSQTGQNMVRIPPSSSPLHAARLSPNGQLLWVASLNRLNVFAIPLFPEEDAELLARWAEAVAGWSLDGEGRLVEMSDQLARLEALRRETAEAPLGHQLGAASLIRWFLSDPRTRTMSPVIDLTVEQAIRRHLAAGDWKGAAEAFPGHPLLREYRPVP